MLEVDSVVTLNECHPADCSGLCSLCHLFTFLSSLHRQQVLRYVPLICVFSAMYGQMSWVLTRVSLWQTLSYKAQVTSAEFLRPYLDRSL